MPVCLCAEADRERTFMCVLVLEVLEVLISAPPLSCAS